MSEYTQAEQQAYNAMQARLVELLLRHDEQRFHRFYQQHSDFGEHSDHAIFKQYRDLATLFVLRDELFEHILPRIVRRLSFDAPRDTLIEELPAQGRINWEQTLAATWQERPDDPPLVVHTRQRRRHFATPENILTVLTLLEFAATAQQLLDNEHTISGIAALQHPLNDLIERCERELAFPQFAGLRSTAQQLLDNGDDPSTIEQAAQERIIPGQQSGYQELLDWRERWRSLGLLERTQQRDSATLGADPSNDNKLYELWIFYELADLLSSQNQLKSLHYKNPAKKAGLILQFTWGDDPNTIYELQHNQEVADLSSRWTTGESFPAPRVRPDFYLRRIEPASYRVADAQGSYWQEPGMVWDAKYYRERDSAAAPSLPIKRMLADLSLLGESEGTLIFAFLKATDEQNQLPASYSLRPEPGFDQQIGTPPVIHNLQLTPDHASAGMRQQLSDLLDQAQQRLHQPIEPACHGVFLDALSINPSLQLSDRYGKDLLLEPAQRNDLLICPKPHIGAWRVDLVNRVTHCLQDPRVCHVIGQANRSKPVRPPRTAEELLRELQQLFSQNEQLSENDVSSIAEQVEIITRRFAEIMGVYRNLELYYKRLGDLGLEDTFRLLGRTEQESLGLSLFLLEQLDSIHANDYSAPAIHISSVMEVELKKRVFRCPGLVGRVAEPKNQTLGTLPFYKRSPWESDGNWDRILAYVGLHWKGQVDPEMPEHQIPFELFIDKALNRIAQLRNQAAHTNPVSRTEYRELQMIMYQGKVLSVGALNILLRVWQ